MSTGRLEKLLYDLAIDRGTKERFRSDPAALLARLHLTDMERDMVLRFDVRGLADRGINVMLLMGYWMELEGSRDLRGYVARMNQPALCGEASHG